MHVKELVDKAFKMAAIEEPDDEFIEEIKGKIEELKDAEVERIEAEREGKDYGDEEPPEIDRDAINVRIPDEFLYTLLKKRLSENDCRNRGFVLDGFPRSHTDT